MAKQYGCGTGCLALFVIALVGFLLIGLFGPKRPPGEIASAPPAAPAAPQKPSAPLAHIGDIVTLGTRKGGVAMLALTDDGWNEMLDAQNRGDKDELVELVKEQKITAVPAGTRAKVLQMGIGSYQVRIMEGMDTGLRGWIQSHLVHPAK